ncbi:unnamed protein product [Boreogadus saida]
MCSHCKMVHPVKERLTIALRKFEAKREEWASSRKKNHNMAVIKQDVVLLRLSSTAGAVGRRLGKCHYKYQVNTTTTNRTSSGNPFLSNFIPTPGNEAEEK